jgi:predicted nucleic acid-binding protein
MPRRSMPGHILTVVLLVDSIGVSLHVVLDTNVWLDVLVFKNELSLALLARLLRCNAHLMLCDATSNELLYQLNSFSLHSNTTPTDLMRLERAQNAATQYQAIKTLQSSDFSDAQFMGIYPYTNISILSLAHIISGSQQYPNDSIRLPKCKDKDDQVFISLASHTQCALLITHDKALLKCRRYVLRDGLAPIEYGLICTPAKAMLWLESQHQL